MHSLRALFRQFRLAAMALLVLAFLAKAAIPAGFMVAHQADKILTVTVCADASGGHLTRQIAIPMKEGQGKHAPSPSDSKDGSCLFSSLSMAAFGGLPPALLALALALAALLGLAPLSRLTFSASRNLRPPLRGPPPLPLIA